MHRTAARTAPLDFLLPSNPTYNIDRRKDVAFSHYPQRTPSYLESLIRDGLRTPPADDMSTAYQYQPPPFSSYDGRQDAAYPTVGSSGSNYAGSYARANVQARPYSTLSQPSSASTLRNEVQAPMSAYNTQSSSPQPSHRTEVLAPPEGLPRRRSADVILPSLQIPPSINNSGGSLAEFAAQLTCLFWFESAEISEKAEQTQLSPPSVQRLRPEALPSSGFRKWVVTILSTTQVTPNVILLALLFIYRLKKINPTVKGRQGSEYRLLTVALMLGNKFLDDNTYTNKTWAEVSGISVGEIHVMEVEFLSNMRYSLLASKEQWEEWQKKLGRFWDYCDLASRAPLPSLSPQAFGAPAFGGQQVTLPSPPSMQASPASATSFYPPHSGSYHQQWPTTAYTAPVATSLPPMPELDLRHLTRKRSYDGDSEEPAAKRITRPHSNAPNPFDTTMPPLRQDAPRLPVPNLTISTSQPMSNNYEGVASFQQNLPVLPPLNGRAMSTVYHPSTPTWTPQLPMLTPSGQSSQQGAHSGFTPSRRQSPQTPYHSSPTIYLQQRNSPYKPIQRVRTLLAPPPSTSMHGQQATIDQMRYQPLGQRNEFRTGLLPGYHVQYPVLPMPQPNFHI